MASLLAPTDALAQPYLSTMPSERANHPPEVSEKVIAITGANRGIGLGIAEVCLSNAVKTVFSLDITDPGDEFKALAERFPGKLEYVQTNVTDEESVEKSINTIENRPPPPALQRHKSRRPCHTLAMEWSEHGIRVNSVSPGFVRTATYYVKTAPDWDLKSQYYGCMPRLADPRELGGAYVYLLSVVASYTTGIDIPVAGIVGAG